MGWTNDGKDPTERARALDRAGAAVADHAQEARTELQQAVSVLRSAVAAMYDGFRVLDERTRAQQREVAELVAALSEDARVREVVSVRQAVRETLTLVGELGQSVAALAQDGRENAAILARIATQQDEVFEALRGLDDLARQSRMLAMNAKIEAHRAGEQGRAFGVVATEMSALMKVAVSFNDQVSERRDLARETMQAVQSGVGRRLASDVEAARMASLRIGDLAEQLERLDRAMTERIGRLAEATSAVHGAVGEAVRGLQFEDIATQLLSRVDERLDRIGRLGDAARGGASIAEMEALAAALAHGSTGSDEHPVKQTDVEAGTVELF